MLVLGAAVGCSSFGGADGASLFDERCCDVPATGGAAGAGGAGGETSAPVGLGMVGSMPPNPSGGTSASPPGATSPADPGNPSVSPDAGQPGVPPGLSARADAGTSGGGPLAPPEPVEQPACLGLALELDGATFAAVPRVVENDFTLEAWVKTGESLSGPSAFNG